MIRGLYFAFIFLLAGYTYAQQSCSQRLNRAEDLYNSGRLLEIPALIQDCFDDDDKFTEGEKIRARKLLTKVYVFTDNEPAAEIEFVALLGVDPVHELQPEDPSELKVMKNKFRTWPIYRLEGKVGGNLALMGIEQSFSAFSAGAGEKSYDASLGLGFQIEVDITRHWQKGIEFGAGFQFRVSKYTVLSAPDGEAGEFETDITNSQTTLRFPIFVRYNLNYDSKTKKLIPYVFAGGSFDYLIKASYSDASRSGGTAFSIGGTDGDLIASGQVNQSNYSVFGGIGGKLKIKKGNFIFAEARFDKSLKLYNVPNERYSNPAITGDLQYVEDDVFLDMVSINAGFIFSVFKPEKLSK